MLAYRVICYAVESSSMSVSEKEKIAAIWRDLLRVVFNMPVQFIYGAASQQTAPSSSHSLVTYAIGAKVVTQYGVGTVISYDEATSIHQVKLSFGLSFLPSSAIIGCESLLPSALEAIGVQAGTGSDIILQSEKDGLVVEDYRQKFSGSPTAASNAIVKEPNFVFYGTQNCYVFIRLFHTLLVRLAVAKDLSEIKQGEFRARRRHDASTIDSVDDEVAMVDPDDSDVESLLGDDEPTDEKDDEKNENGKRSLSNSFTADDAETLRKKTKKSFSKMISKRKSVLNTYLSQLYGLIDGSVEAAK